MKKYRILAIDGGGVRGILPAKLIERIVRIYPQLIEETDLFVGTSAGSFIALGLASGLTPEEIVQWFKNKGPDVFKSPRWFHFTDPKYSNAHLIKDVKAVFGEKRLSELEKKVVVPAFSLIGDTEPYWGPVFFNNFPSSATCQVKVADAALSSSAAPTYFPSYERRIDGGVYANNPSTLGLAFAASEIWGKQSLENISLLSIGTGFFPYQIKQDTRDWGELEWLGMPLFYKPENKNEPVEPLLDVIFDGVSQVDATLTSMFLKDNYFRLNPPLNAPVQLDDVKKLPELFRIGEDANLTETINFIGTRYLG
jgi:uncharacterized protein